jgi:hypothetical protein
VDALGLNCPKVLHFGVDKKEDAFGKSEMKDKTKIKKKNYFFFFF